MNDINNHEHLHLFVEYAPAAIAMFDCEMRYIIASRRWLIERNLSDRDIINRSFYDLEREIPDSWKAIQQRVLAGVAQRHEQPFPQDDGTVDWVKWEVSPWRNSTGEIGGAIVSREIIKERQWAALALQQSEKRFRLLVAGVKDYAIVNLDCEGYIIGWNAGAEHIKGYKTEEILGQHFSCFYEREDVLLGKPQQNLEIAAVQGRLEEKGWRLRKDGLLFWADVVINALHDKEGNLYGFSKVTRDITRHKQIEEYLRLLERAVAASSEGIVITDTNSPDNPMVYVNPSFEQMTGYRKWEVVGRNCRFLQGNLRNQPEVAQLRVAIIEGRECKVVLQNYRKDGTLFWNELRIAPVRNDRGELTNFVGVQTDITERIQAEKELQKIQQREHLLATIAQRIRQSLKLEEVLNTAVEEVRQALQTDRVLVYRFEANWSGVVVVESVAEGWTSVLQTNIQDVCFQKDRAFFYQEGSVRAIEDIYTAGLNQCYIDLLAQFQVRANLVVPILQTEQGSREAEEHLVETRFIASGAGEENPIQKPKAKSQNRLWGLLIAQQCQEPRQWQDSEVEFLKQLSVQLAIAIQQAALFEQMEAELARTKAAETALRDSEQRLQSILDNSPAIMYVKDRQGQYVLVNRQFETMSHLDREQLLGKTNQDIFPKEIADTFDVYDRQVFATETVLKTEAVALFNGVVHTYLSVLFPLRDANNVPYAICGISTDITERKQSEEALTRSNSLLKAQQEAAIDGILIIDENRNVASYNHRFKEMWSIPEEIINSGEDRQLLGHVLSNLKQPQEFISRVEYLYEHPTECSREEIYLNDGRVFDRYSGAVLSPEGNNYGRIWYFRDISDRKRTEAALAEQARLASLRADVESAFTQSDTLQGILHRCNEAIVRNLDAALARIWTFNPEQNALELQVSAGKYSHLNDLNSTVPVGQLHNFIVRELKPYLTNSLGEEPLFGDREWAKREGIVAFAGYPLIVEGCLIGVMTMFACQPLNEATFKALEFAANEIALWIERQQAEEALRQSEVLRQSEAKTRALLDAIPDAMFRIRKDGIYLDFKAAKDDDLALSEDAVIGMSLHDILPTEVAQATMYYVDKTLSTGEIQVFEYQLPNDKPCDYEARLVVNGPDEVLAIVREITERKKIDRLKNEFVSIVSHELRTPLTSVRGSLSLIAGGVVGTIPPEAKALVDIAFKNSERLILLINDILDVEKIESGKMDFDLKPLALMPMVEQAIEANRAYGEQFGVQLILENTLPEAKVNVDRDRVIQVLTNFLSNAAKFSVPNSNVVISVSRHSAAEETRTEKEKNANFLSPFLPLFTPSNSTTTPSRKPVLRIAVTDYGPGIPEEFRPRIFEKFAQADASDSRQKGGTGLGLSICKAIIKKLGGQIGFDTEINIGTTFYFDLPEWHEDIIEPCHTEDSPQSEKRILICEDDPDIAKLLSLMLKQGGLSTDIANNAAQAKDLLTQNCYAAMTIDLSLPGQSGISLIRELREREETQSLPIIVVSAKAKQGREELRGGGFAVLDWLDKPIEQGRLMAALKQAVKQQTGNKPRILHVEDDPDITKVISAILQNIAEIEAATNLQEAKQKLQQKNFDLIILDLSLPDGSGLQLLPDLNNQTGFPIPAVVFSAKEVGVEAANQVAAILIKSRTSNQQLLDTIKSLIGY